MEYLSTKTPRAFYLIRGLFLLISSVLFIAFILLFVLNIDESVKISGGEIIAEEIPIEYLAPFEAQIESIYVREGDEVKEGDTLLVLKNDLLTSTLQKTEKDYELVIQNLEVYHKMLTNLDNKIQFQQKQRSNINSNHQHDQRDIEIEIKGLRSQLEAQKENVDISENRLKKDYTLLKEGIISKLEYETHYKSYLKEKEKLASVKKRYVQKLNKKKVLPNDLSSQVNEQQLTLLSSEYDRATIERQLLEAKTKQIQLEDQLRFQKDQFEKCYVIAKIDGNVSRLFNVKIESNYLPKGTEMIILTPLEEQKFYAEMIVPQMGIKDVKVGQTTHLKLDAYNYYKYGILKGKVSYIKKDTSNNFFVLAQIPAQDYNFELQSGYKIKGEIITEKVKLYQFIFRKLFQNASI